MTERTPTVVVHDLAQAIAACQAAVRHDRRLQIASGGYLGWATFSALLAEARKAVPTAPVVGVFDPDGRAGPAAEALRAGTKQLIFPPDHPQHAALSTLAEACEACVIAPPSDALDLAWSARPDAALDAFLNSPLPAKQSGD